MVSPDESSEEESFEDLLEASLGGVTSMKETDKARHDRDKPLPIPSQSIKDEASVVEELLSEDFDEESVEFLSEESSYLRPGLQSQILKKLRRNFWLVQDELDLHGLNSNDARELVAMFLAQAKRNGFRCVRIIHGKGHRSNNHVPVLKTKLFKWLQLRADILAYCESAPADGGSGATMLLLKAR